MQDIRATGVPTLVEAVDSHLVVVISNAGCCASYQDYMKSARKILPVIHVLARSDMVATHVAVDREPDIADAILSSHTIPMTYAFWSGEQTTRLARRRSANTFSLG